MLIRTQWFGNTLLRFSFIPALIAFFYFTASMGIGGGVLIGLFIWAKYAIIGWFIQSVASTLIDVTDENEAKVKEVKKEDEKKVEKKRRRHDLLTKNNKWNIRKTK